MLLPVAIKGLIPHAPPMLVVDELVKANGDEAISRTALKADSIFYLKDGCLEEAIYFEMMAQTFAAWLKIKSDASAGFGYLTSVKNMSFHQQPRVGDLVEVYVSLYSSVDDFQILTGEARCGQELAASGQLSIYVPGADKELF